MEGTRIGPYRVLGDLGSGGMGKVYLAEVEGKAAGLDAGVRVALKVIHPHLLETPGFFKRFLREAEIGQSVQQDNVVRCYDCDQLVVEGVHQNFLVMEYVKGQTLRDLLNELERVPEELCRHIGREIAKGLAAIHEAGVIHRDLKPENVLITEDHVVKVMDLGVARLQDEVVRLSQTGAFVGSLEYACPEQFSKGGEGVDARSDLYALGVMLYELSTGQHPYRTDDTSTTIHKVIEGKPRRAGEVNPQLSPFFEELVHTLAAKEPRARFASASTLLAALEEGENSEWWRERAKALQIETKRPLRRIRIPRETALYGRDDDLATLHTLYERAKTGDGKVLLIEGEAGIGKTRLVDEFVGSLRQEGEDINFLFGSYPPGGAATAAGAFSTAYREQFGPAGSKDYLAETPILVPAFDALLRGEPPPKGEEPLAKDSIQTVFVHATRALAAERPTVVLIEDLHFAPEEGRALFASLALACPGHRILLVGTMRTGVPEDWIANVERLDHAGRTVLTRLGPKDLSRLLKDAFRSEQLAHELGMRIAEKSDGNPFFAFEIIRGLREGQFISQQPDGTWITTNVIDDIQVPSSVLDLVNARVADLSEAERDLLDVASCCGFEFDPLLVAAVLELRQIPAMKELARIEKKHGLIHAAGANYVFDHHQVQEALYRGLHERLRQPYHEAIAEALEIRAGAADRDPEDLDGSSCADLCEHFLKGARGERALRYLPAATTHLANGYLHDQVVSLTERVLAVPDLLAGTERAKVLLQVVGSLEILGWKAQQRRALDEAVMLADAQGDVALRARARRLLGHFLERALEHEAAITELDRARVLARDAGDRTIEGSALNCLGLVLVNCGRLDEARGSFEKLIDLWRELGDRQGEGNAVGNLGIVFQLLGRYEEAKAHSERRLAIARELGDRRGEVNAATNLAIVFRCLGRNEEAKAHSERALAIAREIGDRQGEANATGNLGNVSFSLGRAQEAKSHYEDQLAKAREIGDRRGEANATGNLGNVSYSLGHTGEARRHHADQLAAAREIGDRQGEAVALVNLGSLWTALGERERAGEALAASLTICREIGARFPEGYAISGLGALAQEENQETRALDLATQALVLRLEIGHADGVASSLIQLGEMHHRGGNEDDACEALQEAIALLRQQGGNPSLALALLANLPDGGAVEAEVALAAAGAAGNTPDTRYYLWKATGKPEHLSEAKRLLDYRVEHAPEEYRESMLKNVRLNREIMEAWAEHGADRR